MLFSNSRSAFVSDSSIQKGGAGISPLSNFTDIIRRQFSIFLIIIPCTVTIGISYLVTAYPKFTATATLAFVEKQKGDLFQQTSVLGEPSFGASWMESQIEVVKSKNVSLAVIRALKLTQNLDFMGTNDSPISTALSKIFEPITAPLSKLFNLNANARQASSLEQCALEILNANRKVTRIGVANDLDISVVSRDPQMAADIANAIANASIADSLEAKYEATRQTTQWLQERISDLRAMASSTEEAVVEFKKKNNIVETAGATINEISSIGEKQISELSSQLIIAQASTSEAKARLDRINEIISKDIPDATTIDSLKSEVLIKLREQYLEMTSRESILAQKYGANHLAAVGIRNQMAALGRNISDEMRKIAQSYNSNYDIARSHELDVRKSLETAIANSHVENRAQVELRELQSKALSASTVYRNFLTRYSEAVQQQSFPVSDARVINSADPPPRKSQPNTLGVLLASVAGGMVLAFVVAFAREASDRVFRTGRQVQDHLHVSCLAMLPYLKSISANAGEDLFHVVDTPFSHFTESLRSLKVMADVNSISRATSVIGFTSTIQKEGKSTIASNYAAMIAHSGARVALVDADLRRSSLSRRLFPAASAGLIDVAAGRISLEDAGWTDQRTGLFFLPAGPNSEMVPHPNEFLASDRVKSLFERLRNSFDHVIVDLAPLSPIADTRATVQFIDSYVYVIEWGVTKIDSIEYNLSNAREIFDKLLGVVLNKVDMKILGRYERYGTNDNGSYPDYRYGED